jgi:DNA-binding Xre family transcriptional regulator
VDWKVDFYQEPDGAAPVEAFLEALSVERRAKALALIQELRRRGPALPFPYSSQVEGRIRELRTQYGRDKIRILYFGDSQRNLILLHGLIKRSDKLDKSHIAIAADRMTKHEARLIEKLRAKGETLMATRFDRYFENQMKDPRMRDLVEKELASLDIGVQIAKLREKRGLNQTQLAARARMSGPKVSNIERRPANVQLDTLIRLCQALGARLEVRLVEKTNNGKRGRRAAGAGAS